MGSQGPQASVMAKIQRCHMQHTIFAYCASAGLGNGTPLGGTPVVLPGVEVLRPLRAFGDAAGAGPDRDIHVVFLVREGDHALVRHRTTPRTRIRSTRARPAGLRAGLRAPPPVTTGRGGGFKDPSLNPHPSLFCTFFGARDFARGLKPPPRP